MKKETLSLDDLEQKRKAKSKNKIYIIVVGQDYKKSRFQNLIILLLSTILK